MFGPNVAKIRTEIIHIVKRSSEANKIVSEASIFDVRDITSGVAKDLVRKQLSKNVLLDISKNTQKAKEFVEHRDVQSLSIPERVIFFTLLLDRTKEQNNSNLIPLELAAGYQLAQNLMVLANQYDKEKNWRELFLIAKQLFSLSKDLMNDPQIGYISMYYAGQSLYQLGDNEAKKYWDYALMYYPKAVDFLKNHPEGIDQLKPYQDDIKTKMQKITA